MIAAGLLEAVAALVLNGLALVTMLAGMHTAVLLQAQAASAQTREFRSRQVEFLLETAATLASPADATGAVLEVGNGRITLQGDSNVSAASGAGRAKPTTIALLDAAGKRRLIHRIGRQTMTLTPDLPRDARLDVLDSVGAPTGTPASAALIRLRLSDKSLKLFAILPGRR